MNVFNFIPRIGGKAELCMPIIDVIKECPYTSVYIEPYLGGGRVLLNKMPHAREIANDMDSQLMMLWAAVKDDIGYSKLLTALYRYGYAEESFYKAKRALEQHKSGQIHISNIDIATYMYVLARQSKFAGQKTFKKSHLEFENTSNVERYFFNLSGIITNCHYRIQNTELRHGDGKNLLIEFMDRDDVLAYCDPSYWDTKVYNDNLTRSEHDELVDIFLKSRNKIILSGYNEFNGRKNTAYQRLERNGWRKQFLGNIAVSSSADGGMCRRADEFIWMNF